MEKFDIEKESEQKPKEEPKEIVPELQKQEGIPSNEAPFELLIQPQMDFEEGAVKTNEKGERLPATPEEIQEMDRRIEKLSQLFSNTKDIRWTLDGAMNISLLRGEYIGCHKDNDVSVAKEDLSQFEEQLYKNGYGLFLSERKEKVDDKQKRIMRRVGHKHFDNPEGHMLIAPIDEKGRIPENQALNYVDLHLIKRNKKGEPITSVGAVMPDEWALPQPTEYKGNKINLSHPSRVLYYKLHEQDNPRENRNYDKTDIERLLETGVINLQDVDEIEKVYIDNENQANIERARKIFEGVAEKIKPDMSSEEIFNIFMRTPEIAEKGGTQNKESFKVFSEKIKAFAEKIAGSEDKSADAMVNTALASFGSSDDKKRKQIEEIRQKVRDIQKLKEIREELKKNDQ